MRRIPSLLALVALAGGMVALATAPAGADEADATEASDLIDLNSVLTLDLLSLGLDANVTVAGTGIVDATVTVGP